jgi:hypothetical protein
MANNILTNDLIFKTTLVNLRNTLGTAKAANRNYEQKFIAGVGESVRVQIPVRTVGRTTNTIVSFSDYVEQEVDLTINRIAGDDKQFSQRQLSRDLTDFSANVIKPITLKIASLIDSGLMDEINLGFSQAVGDPTAALSGFNQVDNAKTRLVEMSLDPADEFFLGLSPKALSGIRQGQVSSTIFTPVMNDKIVLRGSVGMYDGFQVYQDQQMLLHTTGTFNGTPLVNGASQTGTTLNTDGYGNSITGVLKEGDIITIADVYEVDKITFQSTGRLMQFNVQADASSNGSGQAALTISPGIVTTGAYQNVSNAPADNAAITCAGVTVNGTAFTFRKNVFMNRFGLTLAAPPLQRNPGAYYSRSETEPETRISIAMNVAYAINTNDNQYRWDVYYGGLAFNDYGGVLLSVL